MLSKRLATDVRDLFSTVGPSPKTDRFPANLFAASTLSEEAQMLDASGNSSRTGPPRLLLLPSSNSDLSASLSISKRDAGTGAPSLFTELLATTAHRSAAFFAEAAVLVLVLGILDRFLASSRLEPRWVAGAFLVALGLLAASIATDVTARRWLRAH